jgi:hypothetical protein
VGPVPFSIGGGVVDFSYMPEAKETTLKEVGEMLTHVAHGGESGRCEARNTHR